MLLQKYILFSVKNISKLYDWLCSRERKEGVTIIGLSEVEDDNRLPGLEGQGLDGFYFSLSA